MEINYGFISSSTSDILSPSFFLLFSVIEIINVQWFCRFFSALVNYSCSFFYCTAFQKSYYLLLIIITNHSHLMYTESSLYF